MILVEVDASIALKWFLRLSDDELDVDYALALLTGIDDTRIQMVQPAYFIAEVAAVLAREKPREVHDDLLDLIKIECRPLDTPDIHASALDLAIRYQHHLFDTLYHAVALHIPGTTLVTADWRYYEKARSKAKSFCWRTGGEYPMRSSPKTQFEPQSRIGKIMSWIIATVRPLGECLSKRKPFFLMRTLCLCGEKFGFIFNGHISATPYRRSGLSRDAAREMPKGGAISARRKEGMVAKAMRCTFALPRIAAEAVPTGIAL